MYEICQVYDIKYIKQYFPHQLPCLFSVETVPQHKTTTPGFNNVDYVFRVMCGVCYTWHFAKLLLIYFWQTVNMNTFDFVPTKVFVLPHFQKGR